MQRFTTRTVVITGAGSGLGKGLALEFARLGWNVAVCDIINERAVETARLVNAAGGRALVCHYDVTRPGDVESLAINVIKTWGSVDILINNAGIPVAGYMEKIPLEDWRFEIDAMLMSVIYGCRTFIPIFKRQGRGHIVNTASAAGIVCLPEYGPYSATKAAVIALSETLYAELRKSRIGITVVCPTWFKTNLLDQGRCTDERQLTMSNAWFDKFSFGTVETVSRSTIKAVRKNRLYVLPQPDAKLAWIGKRLSPSLFQRGKAFLYASGLYDKILGI